MIQCRENNIPKIKTKNKQTNSYSKRNKNYLGQFFWWKNVLEYSNQFDMFELY